MADAIVGLVLENLNSLILREFSLIYGVRDEMSKLADTLSTIRDVLADAERRHITEKPIANWLMKLKHAAYDTDDVLAEWLTKADEVSTSGSSFLSSMNLLFRRKMAKKIKKMLNTFDDLGKQKRDFILKSGPFLEMHSQFDENRETTSRISESRVYGRDEDKKNITHMLLNNEGGPKNVTIFPIVGMGGLGKTTLAQSIYNDESVEKFFEPRIWVCVSDPFDVKRVLKAIIEAKESCHCNLETLEPIKNKVGEILNGNKYLLVLDDVWNEEEDKWNQLRMFLEGGAQGSSIILTTRSPKVASITSVVQPYNLEGLSDNDCWLLMKSYAFGDSNEEEHHQNLVPIGKAIAGRCKGLPLVAKTLGGLLGLKTEDDHWNHVKDNAIWNVKEGEEDSILLVLRLSYDHLPSYLKQCFAICSIYPKDYRMEREKLINLWIANGYTQSQENKELEEIGNDTFDELLQRSFFQDAKGDAYENTVTCKMHDLMHDLAVSVSLDECLAVEVGESIKHVPKTIRHLTVITESSTLANPLLTPHSSFRTLLFFDSIEFDSFKFSNTLRVLDLSHMEITKLPPSIFDLKLLRYLDLSYNDISLLPKPICKLRNLQMLDLSYNRNLETLPSSIVTVEPLRYLNLSFTSIASLPESFHSLKSLRCLNLSYTRRITSLPESIFMLTNLRRLDLNRNWKIRTLPPDIGKLVNLRHLNLRDCWSLNSIPDIGRLVNLRHLNLRGCSSLNSIPESVCDLANLQSLALNSRTRSIEIPIGIGKLTRLRTLGGIPFIVRQPDRDSDEDGVGINELQRLNQLRGTLEIDGLENVRNAEEARTANLGSKQYLTKLVLSWHYSDSDSDSNNRSKEVLEGLLHPHPPPNLQSLQINNYGAEEFPPQTFHNRNGTLRYLTIWGCKNLKSLPAEIGHLTALTSLKIQRCEKLASLPQELQKLTSLTSFYINDCDNIECLPVIGGTNNSKCISSLLGLEIHHCRNLTSVSEGKRHLTSLQHLKISYCPKLQLVTQEEEDDFQHLISLEVLRLEHLPQLKALPEGLRHLTSLQHLEISYCPKLQLVTQEEEDDFQHLISLEELVLEDLPQLTALPEGIQRLPMLKTLRIWGWKNLRVLPEWLKRLTTLQTLIIGDCENLTSVSEGIQRLSMLKTLKISRCKNLTSVSEGLRHLTSLQKLKISDCPKLFELVTQEEEGKDDFQYLISLEELVLEDLPQVTALPEGIQRLPMLNTLQIWGWKNLRVLPEWLMRLTTLEKLGIFDSHPDLKARCENDKGEDWHKISHIPHVYIR